MGARGRIPLRFALLLAALALAAWLLRRALAPFFLAMVLAYLLVPVVDRLARPLGRRWSVATVLAGFVTLMLGLVALLAPWVAGQVQALFTSVPRWKAALDARLLPWLQAHPDWHVRLNHAFDSVNPLAVLEGLRATGGGLLGCFLDLLALILVPLILYYLLLEGPDLVRQARELVPPRHRERLDRMAGAVHQRLGGYIRGQLAVALVMALLQSLGFTVLGVPYAWVLGLVAGVSNVVPYSPYLTALPPALLLAYLDGGRGAHLALVGLVFILIQKAEGFYFTPVWVGRASQLHPLEVLIALTAFGFWFGVLGLIFAVPLAVVLKVLVEELLRDYRAHPWFGEPG